MNKITTDVAHAIQWLAAEFKYLQILHRALERIEQENLNEQEKELKKDLRVARYIGRAERRVERNIRDVLDDLEEAKSTGISSAKFNDLMKEIEVPSNQLVNEGSRYVGRLGKQLKSIRTDVKIAEKYPDEAHRQQIRNEIKKFESEIEDLEKWIAALDASLKSAVPIIEEYSKPNHFEESEKRYRNEFCEKPIFFHAAPLSNLPGIFEVGILSHEIFKQVFPFPIKGGGNTYQGPKLVCSYSMDMHYDFLKKYFIDYGKGNLTVIEDDMKRTDAVGKLGHHLMRELDYFKRYGYVYDLKTRATMLKQCIFHQDPSDRRADFPKSIDYSNDYYYGYTWTYIMFIPKKTKFYKSPQHLPWEVSFEGRVQPASFIGLLYNQRSILIAKSKKVKDAATDLISHESEFVTNMLVKYRLLVKKELEELESEKERANTELKKCQDKHGSEFPRWLWDERQKEQMEEACKDSYQKQRAIYAKIKEVKGNAAFLFLEKYFKVKLGDSTVYDVILLFCKKFKVMLVDDLGNVIFQP